ncbi:MAG: hypothetical protein PUE60_06595 [Eubacteriales bacterium]|nr:hypothetical protein [Eubacteriales bacterium]
MPYFSEQDINEAKKRVNDMQKRAEKLKNQENISENENGEEERLKENIKKNESEIKENEEKDDSSLIILALIMLLSREGADNMLILALLYLLF